MTKEQFLELGLSDELATAAAEASKSELAGFIPKARFDEINETKKTLEVGIADRDAQLESLKGIDAKGLQAEIAKLQGENAAAKADYDKGLKDLQLTSAIKLALSGKVHDEDIATQLINRGELVIKEDGSIVGLDEQVAGLQESKAFLFKSDTPETPAGFQRVGTGGVGAADQTQNAIANAFGNVE